MVLEVKGVTYAYDDGTRALNNVDLSIRDGEKVAVIGPNGAGKSTLIHAIAGFRTPFTGTVTVLGEVLDEKNADDVRRHVGLLFQDPDDQIFMPTVEEDVAFGPENLGLGEVQRRVTKALRSTSIEDLAKRRPHRLSHGMKKRVAIAGVLAMDPDILLLDEPTAGLDPRSRSGLVEFLRNMRKTMVIATHDLEAAAEIVDRVVLLDEKVVFDGSLAELLAKGRVLEEAGLEPPQVSRLFAKLRSMGYEVTGMPITVDQGVAETVKITEREKGRTGPREG